MAKDWDGPFAVSLATLDTHEVVKDLLGAGFTDEQASAVARSLRKAQDLDMTSLATKPDLLATKADLEIQIEKVKGEVEKVRADVEKLRVEVGKDISDAKGDILKWMIGTMGFQTVIILAAVVTLIKLVKP